MGRDQRQDAEASAQWFVLVCRECDPDLTTPFPFETAEARGRWASAHKRGTGHDRWCVIEIDRIER